MKPARQIAQEMSQEQRLQKEQSLQEMLRVHEHKAIIDKTNEVKIAHVVQTKLLSDQLSSLLQAILHHLETQKPEITKEEMLSGLDQIIVNVKKLGDVMPKLDTLGKILDKPKENYWTEERMKKVLKDSFPKFPDIKIPEPKAEVRVTDLEKVTALLTKLVAKPDFQKTDITIPEQKPFPKSITVDNLGEVADKLQQLLDKENDKQPEATGFSWNEDANGNLSSFTEIYPNGKVVSEGWNVARVKVHDDRTN